MRVAVLGATGFIGGHLTAALRSRGDHVVSASLRDPVAAASAADGCDVVVNLAGESLNQRWNAKVKERILSSRTSAPRAFLQGLGSAVRRPAAYITASAVGYYGTSETATFIERDHAGNDFLANVCFDWEAEAYRAINLNMRLAIVRCGVVLGTDGGALKAMLPPFKAGAGGVVGSGRQWLSWIHIDDVVAIYLRMIDGGEGVYNATAPQPVTNGTFTHALAEALHRPAVLPVPTIALRMMLGEGADMLLAGQRVMPARLQSEGYRFWHATIEDALGTFFPLSRYV